MDLDDQDISIRVAPVAVGDVIPGIGEVLDIRQMPEDADMDLRDFLMPSQSDSNSKMDPDILEEFLHPSDLPIVFRICLVKFETHSQDKFIISSLRESRDAVWSIHKMLQVLDYLLSEERVDDMEIMPKTKKKKRRDFHRRSCSPTFLMKINVPNGSSSTSNPVCELTATTQRTDMDIRPADLVLTKRLSEV